MLVRVLVAEPDERADRRRRGVEDRHAMALDDVPEAVRPGMRRHALVHERGRAVGEDPVDDIGVARDPAAVCRTPEGVFVLEIEDRLRGGRDVGEIAARGMQNAFRLAGGAARVEHEQRVLGVEHRGLAGRRSPAHGVVPPDVAPGRHRRRLARAAHHHHVVDVARALQRRVDGLLERIGSAAPVSAVGGDDELGADVLDPVAQRLGGEPAEHHAVWRADPRAREHRDRQLGDHRHVERHAVALLDAERRERIGEPAHLGVELAVGERAHVARLALPDDRGLGAAPGVLALEMPVEAVVGDVELAADEPLRERRLPVEHLLPGLEPGDVLARHLGPESLRVARAECAERLRLLCGPVGALGEFRGRFEDTLLAQQRLEVGHAP